MAWKEIWLWEEEEEDGGVDPMRSLFLFSLFGLSRFFAFGCRLCLLCAFYVPAFFCLFNFGATRRSFFRFLTRVHHGHGASLPLQLRFLASTVSHSLGCTLLARLDWAKPTGLEPICGGPIDSVFLLLNRPRSPAFPPARSFDKRRPPSKDKSIKCCGLQLIAPCNVFVRFRPFVVRF